MGDDPDRVRARSFDEARERMIRDQLESRNVTDPIVLGAMRKVPRHAFVSPSLIARAYDDIALPSAEGQTISQPYMVALMTQALELAGGERVLEIGTGTGYQSAVLVEMGARVHTIERLETLAFAARKRLERLGYAERIRFALGDGSLGWPEGGRFEAIVVTAGAPRVPDSLVEALVDGGRLVVPVGDAKLQQLVQVKRLEAGVVSRSLVSCAFVPLIGAAGWGCAAPDTG